MSSIVRPFEFRSAKLKRDLEKAGFDPNQIAKELTEHFAPKLLEGQTLKQIKQGKHHDT